MKAQQRRRLEEKYITLAMSLFDHYNGPDEEEEDTAHLEYESRFYEVECAEVGTADTMTDDELNTAIVEMREDIRLHTGTLVD